MESSTDRWMTSVWSVTLIQTSMETNKLGYLLQDMLWVLDQELSPRDHANNQFQQIPQQKQNTWQQLKQRKKLCGSGNSWRFAGKTSTINSTHDWQHLCNKVGKEPKVPWSNKAHQYWISSDPTSCWGQNNPSPSLFHKWANCRHLHQSAWKRKAWKIQNDAWTHEHPFRLRGGMLTPNPQRLGELNVNSHQEDELNDHIHVYNR